MEKSEIINQIREKKKFPVDVKNKIMNQIVECVLSAIIVYAYFIFLELGAKNIHNNIYVTDLKVFSVSFAIFAVVLLEKGYGNKNTKKICMSLEILIIAIVTMILQYCALYLTPKYRVIIPMCAIVYNIYFFLKAIIGIRKIRTQYKRKSNDIKEIVKQKGRE